MKILEIKHISDDGTVLSCQKNIYNMLHQGGERFILGVCFAGTSLSNYYYLGLDARATLGATDTLASLVNEPVGGGYNRQALLSNEFTLSEQSGIWVAESPQVTFSAARNWTAVSNIFLMSDALLASAALNDPITLQAGQAIALQFAIQLKQS